jgi:putative membrane protein
VREGVGEAMGHGGMMSWDYGIGWFIMILLALIWIALIFAVIFFVVWLVREIRGRKGGREETALEIIRKRYARGEISKEEFEEKKKDIKGE